LEVGAGNDCVQNKLDGDHDHSQAEVIANQKRKDAQPRNLECRSEKRHSIRFVFETAVDDVHVNDGPTYAANEGQNSNQGG